MANKIKVLIVDDSLFMRQMISDILRKDPEVEVLGTATNGEEGLKKIKILKPDVVTLDYEMPGLNGVATLKKIMRQHPVPVVMISAYTKKGGEVTLEALANGAVDYILKPSGSISLDIDSISLEIVRKIKNASKANLDAAKKSANLYGTPRKAPKGVSHDIAVVVGSSTGGTKGVELIIESLPSGFPAPVLIVQHMPEMFTALFANRLNRLASITVKEGEEGDEVKKGIAYIAPGGWHMKISDKNHKSKNINLSLTKDPPIFGLRPAIDPLMESVSQIYGASTIGVILSGMGSDGTNGMCAISESHGMTLAQDEATSVVFGMPRRAIESGAVDDVLPIDKIPERIMELVESSDKRG
jgi:two-component system, chemotaxis family, protein-glutamate methylesterase/glutaminase